MRIGIDYRVFSTDAAARGMGRYTQQQLVRTLARDGDNEYALFCFPGCRFDLIDEHLLRAPNLSVVKVSLPLLSDGLYSVHENDVLYFSSTFQDLLFEHDIDVFHSTTPFIPPIINDFDVCTHVVTLYDLIPLIYPDSYLLDHESEYLRGVDLIRKADHVIAISKSARDDAFAYLGVSKDRISVVYPRVAEAFSPLTAHEVDEELADLRRLHRLPETFLLSVTGIHHSKNAQVLIDAYRRLSAELRREFPLAVVLPSQHAAQVFTETYGGSVAVTCLHDVTDGQLCALYNAATVLVHPSRYEGFGYPVAEAMTCGTPVITTSASSLPEVAGDAALLVDSEDTDGLAHAMEQVCASPETRSRMSRGAREVAKRFAPTGDGITCVSIYAEARRRAMDPVATRPRVAVWSSLPPLPCGVADYTAELVQPLADLVDLEIFADGGYVPSLAITQRHTVHHYAAFERRNAQKPFDVSIFQMGGTSMQEFMYRPLQMHRGIVVLHDLLMALGVHHMYRARGRLDEFRETILKPEGRVAAASFEQAIRKARSDDELIARLERVFSEHPVLGWLVAATDRQIVHMDAAREELAKRYPDARPLVVDMGVVDPWISFTRGDVARVRHAHGVSASSFLVGVFGSIVPIKRLESCLRALRETRERGVECVMVVVGEAPVRPYASRVHALVSELGLSDVIQILGRTSRRTFDELLVACDAVLNLRYPSMKGMSATLIRALAAGKPVLVSDIPEWQGLPDDCCPKIVPDDTEVCQIADRLQALATSPDLYAKTAAAARSYYRERGTVRSMAQAYAAAVRELIDGLPEVSAIAAAAQ